MIPYSRQSINSADREAVADTLRSLFLTQGPAVARFEEALARYIGARFAVAASSGTAALHLAYLAAGIGKGDEVITTPNTFVATTNMLLSVGAKPVFVDIRPDTCNIDERRIEDAVTRHTKAVVPVHFAGHPCEMGKITAIAKKHKLIVIEDACHALGASYHGTKIGASSPFAVVSFHPVKSITTGEGGAIFTSDKKSYERMRLLRSHGIEKDARGRNIMRQFGFNYRLSDIHASLGISQLKRIELFLRKRRRAVSWYRTCLQDVPHVYLPEETEDTESSWHLFVVRIRSPRDHAPLCAHLKEAGIGVNFHYPPVYGHPYYRERGYGQGVLEEMDRYAKTAVTLPLYPDIAKEEVRYVCKKISDFFRRR